MHSARRPLEDIPPPRVIGVEEHERAVLTDTLTELHNRRWLNENLSEILTANHGQIGLLFIDMDGFKQINDTLGHQVGDEHLIRTSIGLRHSTAERPGDVVVRLEGDEFLIVLPGIDSPESLNAVKARIQEELDNMGSGASIGGVLHQDETAAEFLRKADLAMLEAKKKRKLEGLSHEQIETVRHIGKVAEMNGIAPRDIPAILEALRDLNLET